MSLLSGKDPLAGMLVELLGLPKHTTEFTLRMVHDELATVTATFYVDEPLGAPGFDLVTRSFNLVPTE